MDAINKPELNSRGTIILPQSVLEGLIRSDSSTGAYLFQIQNIETNKYTHCGVLEFTAMEGVVHLPRWMFETLGVRERGIVRISTANLPRGSFVKFQPHTIAFCNVSNIRAVLEIELRNYSTLTQGDEIMISYNSQEFYFNILEVKDVQGIRVNAICIINCNLEVDFEAALDYVEPQRLPTPTAVTAPKNIPEVEKKEESMDMISSSPSSPGFIPFSGTGYSLRANSKPPSYNNSTKTTQSANNITRNSSNNNLSSNSNNSNSNSSNNNNNDRLTQSSPANPASPPTDVVFKSRDIKYRRTKQKDTPVTPTNSNPNLSKPPGFVPFSGKGNTLQ